MSNYFSKLLVPAKKSRTRKSKQDAAIEVLPAAVEPKEDLGLGGAETVEVLPPEIVEVAGLEVEPDEENLPAARGSDVVPYDGLVAYLRDIKRFKPLSREEEQVIARQYYESKDVEAAYRLVSSNLWLVVKIARDYERAARSIMDLVQEGNIGLMEAVKNFDPYRGVRFPSYAVWWIKAYIIRYVIANWRLVKIGTTQAQRKLFFNLKKEKERLEREGFYPAPKLLAEKLDVRESDVIEMEQRLNAGDLSVDAPMGDENDSTLLSLMPAGGPSAEDLLAGKEFHKLLAAGIDEFASGLNEKERTILRDRVLGEDKATLQELADKLALSKERIRQLENRTRERLKEFLQQKLGQGLTDFEQS